MNKAELVESIAEMTNLPKAVCKDALEACLDSITQALKSNKSVVLTGFGSFKVAKRKARMGVNPATGKKMQIPARKVARFSPGKALRGLIK
ncbi:HU family DNA-binding protein [Vermiphilus pyriformis]|uniref:DNA-binding protein n=1 Tax=candidate division TM6 bacterium JCVI TM6SC1 TaxID=1306947 RepID=A0A0D2JEW9_9BACT|nr:hypothetical protein J120_01375 [candidate division TM6 bacterium JCVI TM6SC1]UNE35734.1 MAG: HU family DNA-binding protein [Vermiphilus pyriformis]